MDNNRFFKFVWRANALVLLGCALFALVTIASLTLEYFFFDSMRTKPPVQQEVDGQTSAVVQDLKIRKTNLQTVSNLVYLELVKVEHTGGIKSYSGYVTYNVGIHSLITNETNWIFPTNNQQIDSELRFSKKVTMPDDETKSIDIGHLFSSLTTDKQGEIQRDIWVTDIYGNDRRKILSNVADEPDIWYYGDNKAKLVFETDKRVQLVDFDLFTREVGETTIVEPPK